MSTIGPQMPNGEDVVRGILKALAWVLAIGLVSGALSVWLVMR